VREMVRNDLDLLMRSQSRTTVVGQLADVLTA
jgi:hypothetical protein